MAIMPRESLFQRLLVRLRLHRLGFLRRWVAWNAGLIEGMDRARGKLGNLDVPIYAISAVSPLDDPKSKLYVGKQVKGAAAAGAETLERYATHTVRELHELDQEAVRVPWPRKSWSAKPSRAS